MLSVRAVVNGYVVHDKEGATVTEFLAMNGIAAAVLKYRLPNSKSNIIRHETPLMDANRAIRLVRYHAADWRIDRNQVGIMSFSTGGHLASTAATQFDTGDQGSDDPIQLVSSRPDVAILVYPIITMSESYMHGGSRDNLLGEPPSAELIKRFSSEMQVTENTSPVLLIHAGDDQGVPVDKSIIFYQALIRNGVSAEMHIYPSGGHGSGMTAQIDGKTAQSWPQRCIDWLQWLNGENKP